MDCQGLFKGCSWGPSDSKRSSFRHALHPIWRHEQGGQQRAQPPAAMPLRSRCKGPSLRGGQPIFASDRCSLRCASRIHRLGGAASSMNGFWTGAKPAWPQRPPCDPALHIRRPSGLQSPGDLCQRQTLAARLWATADYWHGDRWAVLIKMRGGGCPWGWPWAEKICLLAQAVDWGSRMGEVEASP